MKRPQVCLLNARRNKLLEALDYFDLPFFTPLCYKYIEFFPVNVVECIEKHQNIVEKYDKKTNDKRSKEYFPKIERKKRVFFGCSSICETNTKEEFLEK